MKNLFVIALISIFVFGACSTVKMESDPQKASPVIVYSKGPCFGKCPIFTMTIYNTGLVKYNGRRYTSKNGKHEKTLDKKTYTDLVKSFRKNRFWRFDDTYGMDLVDAPTTTISFSDEDKVKTIKGKSQFPEKLKELMIKLDTLANSKDGWLMTEKPNIVERGVEIIENQIIVKSGEGMIMSRWLQKYKKYGVRLMKRIGDSNEYWLIRFDKNKINPKEMLKMIQDDKFVSEAEFNKKLTDR